MVEKIFSTRIKEDHKFGENEYVRGRISGIQSLICVKGFPFKVMNKCGHAVATIYKEGVGHILTVRTTQKKYDKFKEVVEKLYPDLCEFDYSGEVKIEIETQK